MSSRPVVISAVAAAIIGAVLFLVLGRDSTEKPRPVEPAREPARVEIPKAKSRGPCEIQVKRNGIWLEGRLVDSTGAAAFCRINGGSAEIEIEPDAPEAIITTIERAFKEANVPAEIRRL